MPDLGLTHVALPATDLERSADFYERYAQMHVVHRRDGVMWLSDQRHPFVIVLIESDAVTDPLRPSAHLGVACASRAEIDRLAGRARAESSLVQEPQDSGPPVGYWALLRDPDGHTLEISHGQQVGRATGN